MTELDSLIADGLGINQNCHPLPIIPIPHGLLNNKLSRPFYTMCLFSSEMILYALGWTNSEVH